MRGSCSAGGVQRGDGGCRAARVGRVARHGGDPRRRTQFGHRTLQTLHVGMLGTVLQARRFEIRLARGQRRVQARVGQATAGLTASTRPARVARAPRRDAPDRRSPSC